MSLKTFCDNISANIVFHTCKNYSIKHKIISDKRCIIDVYLPKLKRFVRFHRSKTVFNAPHTIALARNKKTTNQLLRSHGIPVPLQYLGVASLDEKVFAKRVSFVLKDIYGAAGENIWTDIQTSEELGQLLKNPKISDLELVLEEQIQGDDHRILMMNGKILDVIQRIRAHVVGDGKSEIRQLVQTKNQHKTQRFPLIVDKRFLKKMGYSLDTILAKDKKVNVTGLSGVHKGGSVRAIDKSLIHPDNMRMLKKIQLVSGLNLVGIDFLTADITKSWKDQKAAITEINGHPTFDLHLYAHGLQKTIEIIRDLIENIQIPPTPRCNWLTNQILIGSLPIKGDIAKLKKAGVKVFVNLRKQKAWYSKLVEKVIHFAMPNGGVVKDDKTSKLVQRLEKIVESGKKVYVHCHGGCGRAGTIGALLIGKMSDLTCERAVQMVEFARNTRPDQQKAFIPTPETKEQIQQIFRILGGSQDRIPDRSDESWKKILRKKKRKR